MSPATTAVEAPGEAAGVDGPRLGSTGGSLGPAGGSVGPAGGDEVLYSRVTPLLVEITRSVPEMANPVAASSAPRYVDSRSSVTWPQLIRVAARGPAERDSPST